MTNRIDQTFENLKKRNKKALIAYITAGDPNLPTTEQLVYALEKSGVDIIELGIPFSDPLADGTTIQEASKRALLKGTTLAKIFDLVRSVRCHSQVPLCFMSYYNPIFHYGEAKFIAKCKEVGIDGLIIPDLPPEEAGSLRTLAFKVGISTVFFVAPTTVDERIKSNALASTGFIYYVALTGVTGNAQAKSSDVIRHIRHAKQFTSKPICAGFGISTPSQVKEIARAADGVIVGSAIIKVIQQHAGKSDLVQAVSRFAASLAEGLK